MDRTAGTAESEQLEGDGEDERLREKRDKKRLHRSQVIREIIQTERTFCEHMELLVSALSDAGSLAEILSNLPEVIVVSRKFLGDLETRSDSVGQCFLDSAEAMRTAYRKYLLNYNRSVDLLRQHESDDELIEAIEVVRSQVPCTELSSMLIKPVQRILKYNLFIAELIKCGEDEDDDRRCLLQASDSMNEITRFINESKFRKEQVDRYVNERPSTLSRRADRFSVHSINKKTMRMSQKFLSNFSADLVVFDPTFESLEARFSDLARQVRDLARDSEDFIGHASDVIVTQSCIAQHLADILKAPETENYKSLHAHMANPFWDKYYDRYIRFIVQPLSELCDAFRGPEKLIKKRHDKALDYSAALQLTTEGSGRTAAAEEAVDITRRTYEALNEQLKEDLPKLIEVASKVYTSCAMAFILLRRPCAGYIANDLFCSGKFPFTNQDNDISDEFTPRHSLAYAQLMRITSEICKDVTPEPEFRRTSVNTRSLGSFERGQSNVARARLLRSAGPDQLFQVRQKHSSSDPHDLTVRPGDMVVVIVKKHPSGDEKRWFVDNGLGKGFVPRDALVAAPQQAKATDIQPAQSFSGGTTQRMLSRQGRVEGFGIDTNKESGLPRSAFFVSKRDVFAPNSSTLLAVKEGQALRLVEETSADFWTLEDRAGQRGLVHTDNLDPYPGTSI